MYVVKDVDSKIIKEDKFFLHIFELYITKQYVLFSVATERKGTTKQNKRPDTKIR